MLIHVSAVFGEALSPFISPSARGGWRRRLADGRRLGWPFHPVHRLAEGQSGGWRGLAWLPLGLSSHSFPTQRVYLATWRRELGFRWQELGFQLGWLLNLGVFPLPSAEQDAGTFFSSMLGWRDDPHTGAMSISPYSGPSLSFLQTPAACPPSCPSLFSHMLLSLASRSSLCSR